MNKNNNFLLELLWGLNELIKITYLEKSSYKPQMGFSGGASGKEPTYQCRRPKETQVWSLGREDPLEEGTAAHFSILA